MSNQHHLVNGEHIHLAPNGIIEDVLIKVRIFTIPMDFIILDFEADARMPAILGCPFLATKRTLLDVKGGKMTIRVYDK